MIVGKKKGEDVLFMLSVKLGIRYHNFSVFKEIALFLTKICKCKNNTKGGGREAM